MLSTVNSLTLDQGMTSRHQDPAISAPSKVLNLRHRSHTVRPKTTYFPGMEESNGPATIPGHASASGDHVISYPQLVSQSSKGSKVKEKKKVSRSSTFRSKEKKEKEEKEKDKGGGGGQGSGGGLQGNHLEDSSRVSEQLYISCITALKASLEEMMVSGFCCMLWWVVSVMTITNCCIFQWTGVPVYTKTRGNPVSTSCLDNCPKSVAGKWFPPSTSSLQYTHSNFASVANSLQLMKTMFELSTTTNYACSSPKVWPAARQLFLVENLDPCHFS